MDIKDGSAKVGEVKVQQIDLLDDGYSAGVTAKGSGIEASFKVKLSRHHIRVRWTHRPIKQLTDEAQGKVADFCRCIASSLKPDGAA
jgi:hypothetical protein